MTEPPWYAADNCKRCGACCITDPEEGGYLGGDQETHARLMLPSGECRHLLPPNEQGERLCAVWGTDEQPQFCRLYPRMNGIRPPQCHAYHEPSVLAWMMWMLPIDIPDRAFSCPHCTSRRVVPAQLAASGCEARGDQSVVWHIACQKCGKAFIVSAQQWTDGTLRWNKH